MLLWNHYSKLKEEPNKPVFTLKTFARDMNKIYRIVKPLCVHCPNI